MAQAVLSELGVAQAADDDALALAAEGFEPLASRLQVIGSVNGVTFVDDSLSTNVLPTLAALDAFPGRRVALIAGGFDRGVDYEPLAAGVAGQTRHRCSCSACRPAVRASSKPCRRPSLGPMIETRAAESVEDATRIGYEWAAPDGVVLLSLGRPELRPVPRLQGAGRCIRRRHEEDGFVTTSHAARVSAKAETFTESVIREMTRLAAAHGAVNLAQGFPDFGCPPELKAAAKAAIDADVNQYAITWGAQDFRARGRRQGRRGPTPGGASTPRPRSASPAARPRR